jgi:hypothetical protein
VTECRAVEKIQPAAITEKFSKVGVVISGTKLAKNSPKEDTTGIRHLRSGNSLNFVIGNGGFFFRPYLAYLHRVGYLAQDPGRLVKRALCAGGPPKALSPEEQERFLATLAAATGRRRNGITRSST